MTTTTTTTMTTAPAALRGCQAQLKSAHVDAWAAVDHLAGARESRAIELMTKIEDALAHAQRLAFCVEGDHRADQARGCGGVHIVAYRKGRRFVEVPTRRTASAGIPSAGVRYRDGRKQEARAQSAQ
jgi:hypothetical protein